MSENNDAARDLLGAWALDAVDDGERAEVERALAGDNEMACEARELRETVSMMAESDALDPPEHIRQAVFARIQDAAADADSDSRSDSDSEGTEQEEPQSRRTVRDDRAELVRMRRRRQWWGLAAAAAVVVAIAIPTGVAVNQADRADQAEQLAGQAEQQAGAAQQQAELMMDALADPAAEVVGEDLPDGARTAAVLGEDSAVFTAQGMTELQQQDYQLWVLEGEEAVSAGVMDWNEGRLTAQVEQFPADAALAVTAEPEGGSEQPTSDPMVVLGEP